MGVRDYFLRKHRLCMQSLTKQRKQPPVVILQQSIFYNISIWCQWLRIIRRSYQGVQFMNFHSHIFFNDVNYSYRAAILKKSSLWVLLSYMMWLSIAIMKRRAGRCTLQLNCTSLKKKINYMKFVQDTKSDALCLLDGEHAHNHL